MYRRVGPVRRQLGHQVCGSRDMPVQLWNPTGQRTAEMQVVDD